MTETNATKPLRATELDAWFTARPAERPMLIVAGPCVLETPDTNRRIAHCLAEACGDLGLPFAFKASYDKANRTSLHSDRGPGLEAGLEELAKIGDELGVPTCTDIHQPEQAALAATHSTMLQIPAFLCRQTDLLVAAAETGAALNVKKGQFMAPSDMGNVVEKIKCAGGERLMLTERGTFFGYQRLVNDFMGLGDLIDLAREHACATCFDVTHSTQQPGGHGTSSGGRPDRAPLLCGAAASTGVDALFIECHPDPANGRSDAATMLPLDSIPLLLRRAVKIRKAAGS
ncbi:MAG: 3-deoxy-8-phosphooctulonate synthase [Phycisphaerales bacterium]|nr:3-deoxy-8-phosphooctulonate synthase [Phycisphaerales bacterium]